MISHLVLQLKKLFLDLQDFSKYRLLFYLFFEKQFYLILQYKVIHTHTHIHLQRFFQILYQDFQKPRETEQERNQETKGTEQEIEQLYGRSEKVRTDLIPLDLAIRKSLLNFIRSVLVECKGQNEGFI